MSLKKSSKHDELELSASSSDESEDLSSFYHETSTDDEKEENEQMTLNGSKDWINSVSTPVTLEVSNCKDNDYSFWDECSEEDDYGQASDEPPIEANGTHSNNAPEAKLREYLKNALYCIEKLKDKKGVPPTVQEIQKRLDFKILECVELKKELELVRKAMHKLDEDKKKLTEALKKKEKDFNKSKRNWKNHYRKEKSESVEAATEALEERNRRKYLVVHDWEWFGYILASPYVKLRDYISTSVHINHLSYDIYSYHKELFIITQNWHTHRSHPYYFNLLFLCQKWKQLRPDGEIHMIAWAEPGGIDCLEIITQELKFLLDSYNVTPLSYDWQRELTISMLSYWRNHPLLITKQMLKNACI